MAFSIVPAHDFRIVHSIPGRIRLHLEQWTGDQTDWLHRHLVDVPGVSYVQANALTQNVLIGYDSRHLSRQRLLIHIRRLLCRFGLLPHAVLAPPAKSDGGRFQTPPSWMRVGLRGLLGHAIVDAFWFGTGLAGSVLGLPLAWLGPLHLVTDIVVWGFAFQTPTLAACVSQTSLPPERRKSA
jgi:hypothetical protein